MRKLVTDYAFLVKETTRHHTLDIGSLLWFHYSRGGGAPFFPRLFHPTDVHPLL